jgi:putative toxin-antitoxin system antitoxin component (TIGR02293 family)
MSRAAAKAEDKPVSTLGLKTGDTPALIRQIERGLPFRSLMSLAARTGFPPRRIAAAIGVPERTLARRKSTGKLTPAESERLVRMSAIFDQALELFEGDGTAAVRWLTTPQAALDEQSPWDYCRTELGAREVERLIGRLEHGVFS